MLSEFVEGDCYRVEVWSSDRMECLYSACIFYTSPEPVLFQPAEWTVWETYRFDHKFKIR